MTPRLVNPSQRVVYRLPLNIPISAEVPSRARGFRRLGELLNEPVDGLAIAIAAFGTIDIVAIGVDLYLRGLLR